MSAFFQGIAERVKNGRRGNQNHDLENENTDVGDDHPMHYNGGIAERAKLRRQDLRRDRERAADHGARVVGNADTEVIAANRHGAPRGPQHATIERLLDQPRHAPVAANDAAIQTLAGYDVDDGGRADDFITELAGLGAERTKKDAIREDIRTKKTVGGTHGTGPIDPIEGDLLGRFPGAQDEGAVDRRNGARLFEEQETDHIRQRGNAAQERRQRNRQLFDDIAAPANPDLPDPETAREERHQRFEQRRATLLAASERSRQNRAVILQALGDLGTEYDNEDHDDHPQYYDYGYDFVDRPAYRYSLFFITFNPNQRFDEEDAEEQVHAMTHALDNAFNTDGIYEWLRFLDGGTFEANVTRDPKITYRLEVGDQKHLLHAHIIVNIQHTDRLQIDRDILFARIRRFYTQIRPLGNFHLNFRATGNPLATLEDYVDKQTVVSEKTFNVTAALNGQDTDENAVYDRSGQRLMDANVTEQLAVTSRNRDAEHDGEDIDTLIYDNLANM